VSTGRERLDLVLSLGSSVDACIVRGVPMGDLGHVFEHEATKLAADLDALEAARQSAGPVREALKGHELMGYQREAIDALLRALDGGK
jgi:hypothetical protein